MKIFASYQEADEALKTIKEMKQKTGKLDQDYVKILKETLKHSYRPVVVYFTKKLSEYPDLLEEFVTIK